MSDSYIQAVEKNIDAAGERTDEIPRLHEENARLREERDLLNAILTNVALSMEAFDNYADIHAERSFATEGGKDAFREENAQLKENSKKHDIIEAKERAARRSSRQD